MVHFLSVAKSMGMEIYAPENGFISFSNSPYYSHTNTLAVDVYPNIDVPFPYAPSPVEGTISNIYEFKAPSQRYFETPETEKLVLISNPKRPDLRVRLLHVDCKLEIGTQISVGDSLGCLERSGFFDFWTARHIHIEVRRKEEPLRAKGAFPMLPINCGETVEGEPQDALSARGIKAVGKDYLLVETGGSVIRVGGFWGLGCTVGGQLGVLDSGLPHYGYGGVHLVDSSSVRAGDSVRLWGVDAGAVTSVNKNFALFRCRPLAVYVGGIPFRGFSLYLWLKENRDVKIVPYEPLTVSTTPDSGDVELRAV